MFNLFHLSDWFASAGISHRRSPPILAELCNCGTLPSLNPDPFPHPHAFHRLTCETILVLERPESLIRQLLEIPKLSLKGVQAPFNWIQELHSQGSGVLTTT